jgi:excisionase family DNA binding protein
VDKLIPIDEVRKILGVSKVTLWKWEKQGKIQAVRATRKKVYVKESELNRFIESLDGKKE